MTEPTASKKDKNKSQKEEVDQEETAENMYLLFKDFYININSNSRRQNLVLLIFSFLHCGCKSVRGQCQKMQKMFILCFTIL